MNRKISRSLLLPFLLLTFSCSDMNVELDSSAEKTASSGDNGAGSDTGDTGYEVCDSDLSANPEEPGNEDSANGNDKGDTGDMGDSGDTGSSGDTGDSTDQGDTGNSDGVDDNIDSDSGDETQSNDDESSEPSISDDDCSWEVPDHQDGSNDDEFPIDDSSNETPVDLDTLPEIPDSDIIPVTQCDCTDAPSFEPVCCNGVTAVYNRCYANCLGNEFKMVCDESIAEGSCKGDTPDSCGCIPDDFNLYRCISDGSIYISSCMAGCFCKDGFEKI